MTPYCRDPGSRYWRPSARCGGEHPTKKFHQTRTVPTVYGLPLSIFMKPFLTCMIHICVAEWLLAHSSTRLSCTDHAKVEFQKWKTVPLIPNRVENKRKSSHKGSTNRNERTEAVGSPHNLQEHQLSSRSQTAAGRQCGTQKSLNKSLHHIMTNSSKGQY